jgi:hypothetical protein
VSATGRARNGGGWGGGMRMHTMTQQPAPLGAGHTTRKLSNSTFSKPKSEQVSMLNVAAVKENVL